LAEQTTKRMFITELQIIGRDRIGIILDISKILTDMRVPVKSLNARTTKNNESIFNIRIEINDTVQLNEINKKIGQIPDVLEILRVSS
jgi:GTP pyrophosphokinase